jgi:hypothetical protein
MVRGKRGFMMKRGLSTLMVLLVGLLLMGGLSSATADTKLPTPKPRVAADGPPPGAVPRLESVYVPIRPCRIADTRVSSAGILKHNSTRPFYVRGAAGFTGQGGTHGGCGIPTAATGVSVNATVTGATATGYMANYPAGTTLPLSNFNFYTKVANSTSNPTFSLAAAGTEPSVLIHTSNQTNAHLILDVTGYYAPQIEALINPAGSIYSGSPRVLAVVKQSSGYYRVEIDSNVNYCTPLVHTYYQYEYAEAETISSQYVYVHLWYLNSTTHQETPVDDYFYLAVAC